MRLHRFLALAGVASRRKCEQLIAAGRISVNGSVMRTLGTSVNPEHDSVTLDGEHVTIEQKVYVLIHKPQGYLTSVTDARGRHTVSELVSTLPVRLYPVGRLDMDTEGVLLMTNDGELCHRLTHPRFGVEKTYHAEVLGKPSTEALEKLRTGVDIRNGKTSPARVKLLKVGREQSTLEIIIHEGRKRQVKRMCKAIGHPVVRLKRVEFGGIRLGNLTPGSYRLLSPSEVASLKKTAGL
ncbi:MAG: rRNA pseudouridine synthase [Candidatus Abyssobacteria bacterium SURF_17]|uniref:Pseudouridine synthase n=1 Tax=Candidatus Abyssobacteria bacterium SURF_17 TaxID=2093361 RepID=A0A419F9C4_9BACT|nr:MAG: rRNA pseudouridine synthase [Candidatus Abyssubacteria bacterium SURF_17]